MVAKLISIINEYQSAVESSLILFAREYGRQDILAAWREGAIPKNGKLANSVEFDLHGIGCYLRFPKFEVDFDFAPNGDSDGFDLWRLGIYVTQFAERFPEYQNKLYLREEFEKLKESGAIFQKFSGQSSLYFLNPARKSEK